MKSNQLGVAYLQYDNPRYGKQRPVYVYVVSDSIVTVLMVTSKSGKSDKAKSNRYEIKDWQAANLEQPSFIRVDRQFQLLRFGLSFHVFGTLTRRDQIGLRDFIRNFKK